MRYNNNYMYSMMTIYIFVIIIIIVQCVIAHPPGPPPIPPQICKNYVGDTMRGGACFSTNLNSLSTTRLDKNFNQIFKSKKVLIIAFGVLVILLTSLIYFL